MSETPTFAEVAERLTPPLRRYLGHFLDDDGLAEDLLQESLLRISKALPGFQGRSSLETWALGVATHAAIDHLRSSRARLQVVEMEDTAALPDSLDDVDEPLIVEEMSACVRQEIDSLPGDYRAALVLHDLEGLTAQQTAEVCGVSLATAKIRIHRARARLKQALERDCNFDYDRDGVLRCDRKDDSPLGG